MATTKTIQSVERAFSILEYLQQCGGGERSVKEIADALELNKSTCLLYTSPSPRDRTRSRMPSSA